MNTLRRLSIVLPAAVLAAGLAAAAAPGADRAEEIAAMLPAEPAAPGRPLADRAAWGRLAKHESFRALLRRAVELAKTPLPDSPDELYLDFSRTGNRTRWQRVAGQRRGRVGYFTLAECLENTGRFLPALEKTLAALCAERTWVMPAHDRGLENFHGRRITIDLGSSHLAWDLAICRRLLGEKLSPAIRRRIDERLAERIFDPFLAEISGKTRYNWWLRGTNNWNAVCLAGVTGAALANIPSRAERGKFVAAAEQYSRYFLRGFTPDGYCSEGLGYWGYGFGHYVLLSETVRQATGGKLDLLARPEARAPALFPRGIRIVDGVYPAFADCHVSARPSSVLMHFLARRFGLGARPEDDTKMVHASPALGSCLIYSFPNAATQAPPAATKQPPARVLRSWFRDAGVLVCRPAEGIAGTFGAALKGGHNAEHHNHNDVGSYVVAVGDRPVLVDPGSEVYTARTFSSRRYVSKVLNSFGHPVPVVAGRLQRTGRKAAAGVLKAEFTDPADTFALDLRAAYDAPGLRRLVRTFVYSRRADGSLTVTDEVAFASPQTFENALVTLGKWKRLDERSLLIYDFDRAVRVEIDSGAEPFTLRAETIKEDVHTPSLPTRIAIALARPVAAARLTLRITPVERPFGGAAGLLRNGSFEHEGYCWRVPDDGISSLSVERAAEGKAALKIADDSTIEGSNVSSAAVPVEPNRRYTLRGKVFGAAGEKAVGLYVKFYDAEGNLLNPTNARGHIGPVGMVGGADRTWRPFAFVFRTPANTARLVVWIHSISGARGTAWLDALEIVPAAEG